MSSTRSITDTADLRPAESLEIGPEERRRFIIALILTSIGYRVLDPHQNISEIRAEAYRNGVPVKETMKAWQGRLQRFKEYVLHGEEVYLTVKANRKNTTLEELELFREIECFIAYENAQTGQCRVLDQATLDQFRAGLRLPRPGAPASGKKSKQPEPNPKTMRLHAKTGRGGGHKARSRPKKPGVQAFEGADEEDWFQDLLMKLMTSPPDFLLPEYGADATPWAKTVILNASRDAIRAHNRHERILNRAVHDSENWLSRGNSKIRAGEPAEDTVLRHLEHLENIRAIFRLPKPLADVAFLRYQYGDSYAEIGRALGITENAVKMRLRKIRSPKVRAVLGL